jgi:hypothetical protein
MALTIYGNQPVSVFRLNGADENSASFALGWVLDQSAVYRKLVIETVFGEALDVGDVKIALQEYDEDGGYTDLEVHAGSRFHLILEAKRRRDLPTRKQLEGYMHRLVAKGAERRRLVSVSAADQALALRALPPDLKGVPIVHVSWSDLQQLAEKARSIATGFEEKLWLRQLIEHLGEFVSMKRRTDNNVYVVSLGSQPMIKGETLTSIIVVEKDRYYFHPVGNGNSWPSDPPNYIGFRYGGKLRSVHHVDSFEIVRNLHARNPLWPETKVDHFIYHLGPPMVPRTDVRTGKIYRSGRVWCAIDTLLSGACATISEAREETQRRAAAPS